MNASFTSIAASVLLVPGLADIIRRDLLKPFDKLIVGLDRQIYRSPRRACCPHRLQQQSTDIRHGLGVAGIKRIILLPWFSQTKDLSYTKLGSYDVCCVSFVFGLPRGHVQTTSDALFGQV